MYRISPTLQAFMYVYCDNSLLIALYSNFFFLIYLHLMAANLMMIIKCKVLLSSFHDNLFC